MAANVQALEQTIEGLRGRIAPTDEALLVACRSVAAAVDAEPGNASLWREYRALLGALMEVGSDDDGFQRALDGLRAEIRDAKVGKAD